MHLLVHAMHCVPARRVQPAAVELVGEDAFVAVGAIAQAVPWFVVEQVRGSRVTRLWAQAVVAGGVVLAVAVEAVWVMCG
jgi:hypothetical protein